MGKGSISCILSPLNMSFFDRVLSSDRTGQEPLPFLLVSFVE
jgi:hypothetical protein